MRSMGNGTSRVTNGQHRKAGRNPSLRADVTLEPRVDKLMRLAKNVCSRQSTDIVHGWGTHLRRTNAKVQCPFKPIVSPDIFLNLFCAHNVLISNCHSSEFCSPHPTLYTSISSMDASAFPSRR